MSISSDKRQRALSAEMVRGNLEAEAIPLFHTETWRRDESSCYGLYSQPSGKD